MYGAGELSLSEFETRNFFKDMDGVVEELNQLKENKDFKECFLD